MYTAADAACCRDFLGDSLAEDHKRLEAEVGWRTGLLAAAFCAGQLAPQLCLCSYLHQSEETECPVQSDDTGASELLLLALRRSE